MKKILFAAFIFGLGAANAAAEYDASYYSRMEGKSREALKQAAKECVKDHKELVYMDLPTYWQYSDVYPEKVDGMTRWWEMYSNEEYFIYPGQTAKSSFSANRMQREHSVPKSWWKVGSSDVEYTPAYSDMWNLYPSDGEANLAKSNYPLGVVSKINYDNNCTKVGVPASGYGGGCGFVFEPADEYKGDFARGFFYMATVYDDLPWRYTYMFAKSTYPTLHPWAYEMLLQWARRDPVSQKEIIRNDAVEKSQGNRNPFVDFPELAEYIWGTRVAEVFHIADQGGAVTPPITGDPELTLPVNDEWIDFGEVAVGGASTSWVVLEGRNFTSAVSVVIGGADRSMFTLDTRTIPAASINATGQYMLTVTYTPTDEREHTATLSIYDGGLAKSVRVNLKGTGCPVPNLKQLTALPATDITDTSYTACWEAADTPVDYYVVYRTRYLEDGEDTEELQADSNQLLITGRTPDVEESYQVVSSRLGFLSPASNTIFVAASGVETMTSPTAELGMIPGGFVILGDSESGVGIGKLTVYDVAGRIVAEYENLMHGDVIMLPAGVYVISAKELGKPKKVMI